MSIKPSQLLGSRVTSINHLLLKFLDGNHEHAFFVGQMLYYAQHDLLHDSKWRIMPPEEWEDVTMIKPRRLKGIADKYEWLDSSYKKSPFAQHTYESGKGRKAFNWYAIDIELFNLRFEEWLLNCENGNSVTLPKMTSQDSTKNDKSVDSTKNDKSLIIDNKTDKDIAEASAPPKPRQRNPHFDAITTELDKRNKSAIPSQIGKLVKLMKSLDVTPDDIPQYFEWLDTHKRGIMVEGKMWSWSARNINAYVTDWLDSRTDAQTEDKFDFDNPLWVTH